MIPAFMLQTLKELAPLFDLPSLRPNRHGVVALRLGDACLLHLEFQERRGEHAALLHLARPAPAHNEAWLEHVLRLCDAGTGLPIPVRAGLFEANRLKTSFRDDNAVFGDVLVLMTPFTESLFIVSRVMQSIQVLMDLHRRIASMRVPL